MPVARPTGASYLLESTLSDEPPDARWLVRDAGVLVGFAEVTEPVHEYVDAAFLSGAVHPDRQRTGIGRALLDEIVRTTGRPILRARAWRGTAGARALPALGFRRVMTHGIRRLDLTDPEVAVPGSWTSSHPPGSVSSWYAASARRRQPGWPRCSCCAR